jgi:cell shape-determining protein MreC
MVPQTEPSGGSAPSMDDIKRVLQDAFKGFESEFAKKMAEIESRLKALEEARKTAEEAREYKKDMEEKKAGEAKDKSEDEEEMDNEEAEEAEVEAMFKKSNTLVGKPKKGYYGWNDVVAELDAAMKKSIPTFKG